jgi:nicotinamidase/pyrazinamidase
VTAALIVVDMQNAFVAADGALLVGGADAVLRAVNERVARAADRGDPVFYTRDIEPTQLPSGDPDGQTALADGLDVRGTVVDKGPGTGGGMSGFVLQRSGPGGGGLSDLAAQLRRSDAAAVTIVGLAADVCVAATALDARRLGYPCTIDLDATAFVHAHPGGDQAALDQITAAGVAIVGPTQV